MIQTISNIQAETRIAQLKPLLSRRDMLGYVAARNTRILNDALTEYFIFKGDLIKKYGTEGKNADGSPNGIIEVNQNTANFSEFIDEFSKIADIKHEVDLMTLTYVEVIGDLSGEEILIYDWMLEE